MLNFSFLMNAQLGSFALYWFSKLEFHCLISFLQRWIMPNYSDTDEEVGDLDDVVADLDLETIPPEVAEYARTELGETDELKTRTISELQDMIYGELYWNAYNRIDSKVFLTSCFHSELLKKNNKIKFLGSTRRSRIRSKEPLKFFSPR